MLRLSPYLPFVAAMALVVVASNMLVQFPVQGEIGGLALADILTWGAFTYPVRLPGDRPRQPPLRPGRGAADRLRRLHAGGHLLDRRAAAAVPIRPDRIRDGGRPAGAHRGRLGRRLPHRATARRDRVQLAAPAAPGGARRCSARWPARCSTRRSSSSIAFSAAFAFVGPSDAFALENAPLLGLLPVEAARWMSWALGRPRA